MPRTDKQIAQYMAYYSTQKERKWALDNLCRVEHKTPEEIRDICERYNVEGAEKMGKSKYSEELKQRILAAKREGKTAAVIAGEVGLTQKQVENICTWCNEKRRRKADTTEQDKTADFPEQTGNKPKYDEQELEFEKHIEELAAKRDAFKPKPVPASDDFAVGQRSEIFNDYEPEPAQSRDIKIVVKVPKGVRVWIGIEEEHETGQKEGTDN